MIDTGARPNPYPGLRPFQADETELYFGRDEQRIELLHRLRQSRLLAIVGTSGSGKSSLVRAGLLPGLHGGFMAGRSVRWRIVDLRPGTDAIGNLARALDAPGALRDEPAAGPSFTEATLRRSGLGLVAAVREAALPAGEKVMVLVDQFEELFRALEGREASRASDDASAFVKLLLEAARQDELPIYVVITMRSDFLGECARFRDLPEALNEGQYLVPRLTPDQRTEAIVGPAAMYGVTLAGPLVNQLLNDVGENPDQLPILQHALMRTWDRWQRRPPERAASTEITLDDYNDIGGMKRALSQHADAVYEGLKAGLPEAAGLRRQAIAQRLFKCLAGIGASGKVVRRLARLDEVAAVCVAPVDEVIAVVEAFRAPGNSFLMPPPGEPLRPDTTLDISHESLIRNWERMKAWVDEEAESARVYERLSSTALLHAQKKAALWSDPDLGVALQWQAQQQPNPAWALRYNKAFEPAMAFLAASRAQAEAAEDAVGRQRRRWVFGIVCVFALMLTGMLNLGRVELARLDEVAKQARETQLWAQAARDVLALYAARREGIVAGPAWGICERPESSYVFRRARDSLCDAGRAIGPGDEYEMKVFEWVLEGQWRDASEAIHRPRVDDADLAGPKDLLGRLAVMRTHDDRRERALLLRLQKQRFPSSDENADKATLQEIQRLNHPVHRRIAHLLIQPKVELAHEEELLLYAYVQVEEARDPTKAGQAREAGARVVDALRRLPGEAVYGDLAAAALEPESRIVEGFQLVVAELRDNAWLFAVAMPWPLWRLRRFVQRRRRQAIPVHPNHLRRIGAVLVDVTIAAGVGVLTNLLVEAVLGIVQSLLSFERAGWLANVGFFVAVGAGAGYLLCRDLLRLKFRRSIGMILFDLRPLRAPPLEPGRLTVWAAARRNLVLPLVLLGAGGLGWVGAVLTGSLVGLLGGAALGLIFPLANWLVGRRHGGRTWADRWSGMRIVDADSAESLAVRP